MHPLPPPGPPSRIQKGGYPPRMVFNSPKEDKVKRLWRKWVGHRPELPIFYPDNLRALPLIIHNLKTASGEEWAAGETLRLIADLPAERCPICEAR